MAGRHTSSALVAAGTLVTGLERSADGFEVDVALLGRALGLPDTAGANAKIVRTLARVPASDWPMRTPTGRSRCCGCAPPGRR